MEGQPHAWNAVKLHGAWYLIDPAWNAGSVEGAAFKKQYGTDYLFTPPDHFAITHFPDANEWQLLEKPLTRAEFFRRPVLAPAFFTYGLTLRSPDHAQVTTGSSFDVALDNPRNAIVIADFEPHGRPSGRKRSECRGDGHTKARCDFPSAGTYDVRLFARAKQSDDYTYVGSVQVNARP